MVKTRGFFLAFILFCSPLPRIFGQEIPLSVTVTPNPAAVGNRFSVSILVDREDPASITVADPRFPDSVELWSGPYIRPYIDTDKSGERRKLVTITYTFYARKAGKSIIPEFLVSDGAATSATEPVLLSIGVFKNRVFSVPLETRWNYGADHLFVGESIPLVLEVFNQEKILLFSDVTVSSPQGGIFEEIPGGGEITHESFGPVTLYSIPVKAYLYTPSKTGRVTIENTAVQSPESSGTAAGFSLTVLPVPEEIMESGAIGAFSFSSSVFPEAVEQGGEFSLTMKVSGVGNLNYLQFPDPQITGANLLEKKETSSFVPQFEGYSGSREVVYRLAASSSEQVSILVPSFVWLDREQGIKRGLERRFRIRVRPTDYVKPEFPFQPISEGRFLPVRGSTMFKDRNSYLLLAIGPALFGIFLVLKKLRFLPGVFLVVFLLGMGGTEPTDRTAVLEGVRLFSLGEYGKSAEQFMDANSHYMTVPEILYNLSLCAYQMDEYADAIWYMRECVLLSPMNREYRDLLSWYEESLGLDQQVATPPAVHPDIFFFLLLGFIGFGSLIGIINLAKGKGFLVILLILSFTLAGIAGGFLYGVGRLWAEDVGIVKEVILLKRIPKETAGPWIDLPEGMAVFIRGESDPYYLIETGFGIRGWVRMDQLRLLEHGSSESM